MTYLIRENIPFMNVKRYLTNTLKILKNKHILPNNFYSNWVLLKINLQLFLNTSKKKLMQFGNNLNRFFYYLINPLKLKIVLSNLDYLQKFIEILKKFCWSYIFECI